MSWERFYMTKEEEVDRLLALRNPLVDAHNSILNNIFKYYNPFYRRKLKKIEAKLDELDRKIYRLENERFITRIGDIMRPSNDN